MPHQTENEPVPDEERAKEAASRLKGKDFDSRGELEEELNGDGDVADLAFVELHNLNSLDRYSDIQGDVAVFMPHCLRDREECIAERTPEGFDCKECMKCEIGEVQRRMGDRADVFMVPGGGIIRKILSRKDYAAVIGVACFPELELGKKLTGAMDLPTQMVPLNESGCTETSVDVDRILDKFTK